MRVRRAQSILLSLAMVSTVCGASQAENAAPASVVKPGGEIQIPPAIGKITVKNAGDPSTAGTPGGIENMLAPGTIQQMPTLPSIQQTPEMIEKVHKLEEEGEKLFLQGMLDKALVKWQEAYGMCLEMKYSEGQGRALTNMCRFFLARGQYVKAKYMGENATEVLAETNDKRDLGKARVALAQAYFGLDNPTWAGQQLQLALKDYADLGNSTAKDSAELTGICGNVLLKMGKFKEAVQFQQASAMHLEQAGEYHASVVKRVGVALLLLNLGLYTAAQEEAQRAYSLASSGSSKNPSSVPVALACLGNCQYTLGEYGKALKTFEQASQAAAKLSASQMPELSRANLELGYAHALIASGYPEPAKQKLEKVLPLFKKLNATLEQAQTYNALGMVEETLENHASAVQYFQQALDLQGILNPRKERLHINVLSNLAIAESRAGKNTDARVHMNSILEMFNRKKKPLKDELLKCRVLSAMGEISLKLADVPAAENYLKQAVTIAEKVQDDASLWRDYTLLAKIPSTAVPPVPVNDTLNSALSHFRSPQAGAFPSPERLVWATTREDLGQQLVAMLAKNGMAPQALLAAEQLKDELFIVEWNRRGGQVK
ncbi:MAG TPA: tetratricopeptide repeat protein, partial [Candidatus Obscuribacterales bacterium]